MTLPNFFIVGAAKAGTTSLWRYVSAHPQIFMSNLSKEPHYFLWADEQHTFEFGDWKRIPKAYHSSWDAYLGLFAEATTPCVGEASVFYLPHPAAPMKIFQRCPEARIIMILREPIDRAFSWYKFNRMRHIERAPTFRAAIAQELSQPNTFYASQYVGLGQYFHQVKRYIDTFGEDQVKVLLFDDLKAHPEAVCREIFQFLQIDDNVFVDTSMRHNPTFDRHPYLDMMFRIKSDSGFLGRSARALFGTLSNSKAFLGIKDSVFRWAEDRNARHSSLLPSKGITPRISMEDERFLADFFEADVRLLEGLINRDLSAWLQRYRSGAQ